MMLLHQVLAEFLGFWPALFFVLVGVIFTAGIGLTLLSREAKGVWTRFTGQVQSGGAPTQEIVEGLMLLVGGVCLLTPGYMTDLFGFICVFGKSRKSLGRWLSHRLKHLTVVSVFRNGAEGSGPSQREGTHSNTWSDKEPPRRI